MSIISIGFERTLELHPAGKGPWRTGFHYSPRLNTPSKRLEEKEMGPFRKKWSPWVTWDDGVWQWGQDCGCQRHGPSQSLVPPPLPPTPTGLHDAPQNEMWEMKPLGQGTSHTVGVTCPESSSWWGRTRNTWPGEKGKWRAPGQTQPVSSGMSVWTPGRKSGVGLASVSAQQCEKCNLGWGMTSRLLTTISTSAKVKRYWTCFCLSRNGWDSLHPLWGKKVRSTCNLLAKPAFHSSLLLTACDSYTLPKTWGSPPTLPPQICHLSNTHFGPLYIRAWITLQLRFSSDTISHIMPVSRCHVWGPDQPIFVPVPS